MRRIYKNINNYFQGLSTLKFIIIMVLVTGLVIIPFIPLFYLYEKYVGQIGGADSIKEASLLSTIIVASIIGPIAQLKSVHLRSQILLRGRTSQLLNVNKIYVD